MYVSLTGAHEKSWCWWLSAGDEHWKPLAQIKHWLPNVHPPSSSHTCWGSCDFRYHSFSCHAPVHAVLIYECLDHWTSLLFRDVSSEHHKAQVHKSVLLSGHIMTSQVPRITAGAVSSVVFPMASQTPGPLLETTSLCGYSSTWYVIVCPIPAAIGHLLVPVSV